MDHLKETYSLRGG